MTGFFLRWLYLDAPKRFWDYHRQLTTATLSFFSVGILLKTLLDPWRHDAIDLSLLPLRERLGAAVNNLISRLVGLSLRLWAIVMAGSLITLTTFGFGFFTVAWYLGPVILVTSFAYGLKLLLGA